MNRDGFNSSLYFRIKLPKLHTKVHDQPSHVAHEGLRVEMVVNEVSAKILWGSNKPGAHRPVKFAFQKVKRIASNIGELSALEKLVIECSRLETLPPSVGDLSNLKSLQVMGCPELEELTSDIGELSALEELVIE